jgi:hypothetical protein
MALSGYTETDGNRALVTSRKGPKAFVLRDLGNTHLTCNPIRLFAKPWEQPYFDTFCSSF